ncbi:MAG TPA: S4 domain-containing protein [Saprospiraceae bacterium]|nr:S4 domain-containing protein [Saprospiraceae bacterium]HNT22078.1 S4 domain-containing protein [Saprospiraceae bacterium]
MDQVRADKWLWSIRLFKTRTVAADACKEGRVYRGEQALKASSEIKAGDLLRVHKDGFRLMIRVKDLLEKRVSAQLAREYYENLTPEEELNKYKSWFIGKASAEVREKGAGRPTKKERREIDGYKDTAFDQEIEPWLEE